MAGQPATRIERALEQELEAGCRSGVFPGASAAVALWDGRAWHTVEVARGLRGRGLGEVSSETFYDLASLTKPWVAMTALRMHQAGLFDLGAKVHVLVEEAKGLPVGSRTWEEVLSHRSGLEAWAPFYEHIPSEPGSRETSDWLLSELLPKWDESMVGTSVYSDLGYILAGFALSRSTDRGLDELVRDYLALPLGLEDTVFYGPARQREDWRARCAPTGWSPWRARVLTGEVHDDNCAALGGVAGHAGMFGLARSVAAFGAAWVGAWHGRRGAAEEELIRHATAERPGGTHRLGWDGKAEEGSSAGSAIDRGAFGHLGFTGTSIWCDPRRQLVIVMLSNRVAVSDDNAAIRALRPRFHDAIIAAFDGC